MIKDIVVNLSPETAPDVAGDYAISVADVFRAHLSGIAFALEPILPPRVMGVVAFRRHCGAACQKSERRETADIEVRGERATCRSFA